MADKQTVLSDASTKPPCPLCEANIPDELRLAPFVVWNWHFNQKRGKWDKVPLNPSTRRAGDATDPANQLSCDEAVAMVRAGKADAIGIVLGETPYDTLAGIDLDDCYDEAGQLKSYAVKIVEYIDSYTEVSPSGTGLKVFLFGKLPAGAKHTNKEKGLETYDGKRWFALTGNQRGTARTVNERQKQLEKLVAKYFSGKPAKAKATIAAASAHLLDDESAIDRALEYARRATANMEDSNDGSRRKLAVINRCYDESLTPEATCKVVHIINDERPFPREYDDANIIQEYQRIEESGREREPMQRILTDASNAELLARQHSQDIRYVPAWKQWIIYDGKRWVSDQTGAIYRKALQTVRSMRREASQLADKKARKALWTHAEQSESRSRLDAMVSLAQKVLPLPVSHDELNNNPWLLNFNNGTVDLHTGELRAHSREDFITKIIPHDYPASEVKPVRWLAFLNEIFAGDAELIAFVRRLLGYSLIGEVLEHVFPVAHGGGANGKSTLFSVVIEALGDYAMTLNQEYLMQTKQKQHSTEVMDLYQIRLAVAAETEEGARLNEARVKHQTGGGNIRGRRLFQESWEFKPSHTLFVETNYKPRIVGTDHGIWRRVLLIPFTVQIPDDKQDHNLLAKLRAEIPAILYWLVQACLEWQRDGLNPPASVVAATDKYREESDLFGEFLSECCIEGPDKKVGSSDLYNAYKTRAIMRGEIPQSQKRISERLEKKYTKTRDSKTDRMVFVGITLKLEDGLTELET